MAQCWGGDPTHPHPLAAMVAAVAAAGAAAEAAAVAAAGAAAGAAWAAAHKKMCKIIRTKIEVNQGIKID